MLTIIRTLFFSQISYSVEVVPIFLPQYLPNSIVVLPKFPPVGRFEPKPCICNPLQIQFAVGKFRTAEKIALGLT